MYSWTGPWGQDAQFLGRVERKNRLCTRGFFTAVLIRRGRGRSCIMVPALSQKSVSENRASGSCRWREEPTTVRILVAGAVSSREL